MLGTPDRPMQLYIKGHVLFQTKLQMSEKTIKSLKSLATSIIPSSQKSVIINPHVTFFLLGKLHNIKPRVQTLWTKKRAG